MKELWLEKENDSKNDTIFVCVLNLQLNDGLRVGWCDPVPSVDEALGKERMRSFVVELAILRRTSHCFRSWSVALVRSEELGPGKQSGYDESFIISSCDTVKAEGFYLFLLLIWSQSSQPSGATTASKYVYE